MRMHFGMIAACASSMALAVAAPLAVQQQPAMMLQEEQVRVKTVRRKHAASLETPPIYRRSKNKPTRRRLKANRLHISRRVRRKHRRAA